MERILFSPTVVLQLWTTALPPNIQDTLTVGCGEQTGEAQDRVPDRMYATMTGMRPASPETTALVALEKQRRFEYDLLLPKRGQ